jgi:hypothetical protein
MIINSCTDFITISYSAISVFVADAVDVATDVVVVVDVTFSYIWNSRCCCNNKPEKKERKKYQKTVSIYAYTSRCVHVLSLPLLTVKYRWTSLSAVFVSANLRIRGPKLRAMSTANNEAHLYTI